MSNEKAPGKDGTDDLAETKRIMERLVRTPPKPHKPKGDKPDADRSSRTPAKREPRKR